MADHDPIDITLFHYIKGSHDYPNNHSISKPFGYDITDDFNQKPVFNYSIKDMLIKLQNPITVDNLYTIGGEPNSYDSEKISAIIIDNPEDNAFNTIRTDIGSDMSVEMNRHAAFWSKTFIILDMIKRYESKFVLANPEYPGSIKFDGTYPGLETYYDTTTLNKSLNLQEILGYSIRLMIANPKDPLLKQKSSDKKTCRIFRNHILYNCDLSKESEYTKYLEDMEKQYDLGVSQENKKDLWEYIQMSLVGDVVATYSTLTGRTSFVKFTLSYLYFPGNTYTYNIKAYFVPDDLINFKYKTKFKVHTYNDSDDKFNIPAGEESNGTLYGAYNVLDNDYGNVGRTFVDTGKRVGAFHTLSKEEYYGNADQIVEITKNSGYGGYDKFSTTRVIPIIKEVDGKRKIFWGGDVSDPSKKVTCIQEFLIFHTSSNPNYQIPNAHKVEAVKKYLIDLHSNCNKEFSNAEKGVLTIGHGKSYREIEDFLANMYPNLFSTSSLVILPFVIDNEIEDGRRTHSITKKRLFNTIRACPGFEAFEFAELIGNKNFEIFYIGSEKSQVVNGAVKLSLNFPLICLNKSGTSTVTNPFTSISGLNVYNQCLFDNIPNNANSVYKMQYILIKLFSVAEFDDKNLSEGEKINKEGYIRILGTDIAYERDIKYDKDIHRDLYNVAKFIFQNTEFYVYAHKGSSFGGINGITKEV